jgi:uncharacterized protein (DUF433 family)/predicted nuclease of predicted toxin-antitoxin system
MAVPSQSIITLEPGKRSGKPTMRGTRITVYDILSYLAAGMTHQEILDDFPSLTEDGYPSLLELCQRSRTASDGGSSEKPLVDHNSRLAWSSALPICIQMPLYPDARHAYLRGLDRASDADVWNYAKSHSYTIVTKDSDFNDTSVLRGGPVQCHLASAGQLYDEPSGTNSSPRT